ncbi:MAG: ABC transporter permease [Spirochaetaceae bacterium]|nr:ABC transporter permease [Spirochaetaceae bacterium]
MRTIRSVLTSLTRSPVKSTVTLSTVGLGVGVLIFALSISGAFNRLVSEQLEKEGLVVMVANVEIDEDGELQQVRPPQFDANVVDALRTGVSGAGAASPVAFVPWTEFVVGGQQYRFRSVVGVNEDYLDVMGLEVVAGSAFTAEDVAQGVREALVSETMAEVLFGSSVDALGQVIQPPAPTQAQQGQGQGQGGGGRRFTPPTYTVRGGFGDPSEIQRRAYGVGDMIVPMTSAFPSNVNSARLQQFLSSRIALRVQGSGLATIESQVRGALAQQYGDDVTAEVWEGRPDGGSAALEEARATVATFSLVVNLLGFVLLVTGCIGILSIMLVEVLGRTREIAVERAVGASRGVIAREFFARSLIMVSAAALIGVALSLLLSGPLTELVVPIFRGTTQAELGGSVISLAAIAIGVGSAIGVGGLFGVLPVFSALRVPIAEGMREG